jgi:hypothetical protein
VVEFLVVSDDDDSRCWRQDGPTETNKDLGRLAPEKATG